MRTRRLTMALLTAATMMTSLVATAPAVSAQIDDVAGTTRSPDTAQVIAKWRNWCYTYESGWGECPLSAYFPGVWP